MWRYNRPEKEGYYYCTLIAEVGEGRNVAYGDKRAFRKVDNIISDYRMEGEPATGLGWVRDADGYKNERVLAWSLDEIQGVCDNLPEGTIVVEIEDHGE